MKRWMGIAAGILLIFGCNRKLPHASNVLLASEMIGRLERAADYSDSLKASVLLRDNHAVNNIVALPSGGYGFSRQYLDANRSDRQFYRLIRDCNVSVVAYESLKRYIGEELVQSVQGSGADSIRERWASLR